MRKLFIIFGFLVVSSSYAQIVLRNDFYQVDGRDVEFSVVSDYFNVNTESIESIEFKPFNKRVINLAAQKNSILLKLDIVSLDIEHDWVLYTPIPYFDSISLFRFDEGKLVKQSSSGIFIPNVERERYDPYPNFRLHSIGDTLSTFYIKIKTNTLYVVPIIISSEIKYQQALRTRNIFLGAFAGIMICMFLYNLFLAFYTRDITYVFYIGYVLFIAFAQFSFIGIDYYLVGVEARVSQSFMYLGSAFSGICGAYFAIYFLRVKDHLRRIYFHAYIVLVLLYGSVFILFMFGKLQFAYQMIQFSGLYGAIVALTTSTILSLKGFRSAKIYLLSWSFLIIGLVIYVGKDSGVFPTNNFTIFSLPIGVALETILISIALADRINSLRKDNELAQGRIIEEMSKNESLIRNQNVVLEEKVKQRTEELEQTLENLKKAQVKLVESEKMASLGVLTAGIAHEINNPINYVTANVIPLRENIDAISKLLGMYKSLSLEKLSEQDLIDIKNFEDNIELGYTLTETNELVDGIEEGAKRTYTIVEGLRTFSRGDATSSQTANINTGVQSTLTVLKNNLHHIKVAVDLDEGLPEIECQLGKLNQVFLNLINNAIHAIDEAHAADPSKGLLRIRTYQDKEHIYIAIKDNGSGISEEMKNKVFEPFYTSKPVGKGTGLGLSISYAIIQDHRGSISFDSAIGKGSEFVISLPKNQTGSIAPEG